MTDTFNPEAMLVPWSAIRRSVIQEGIDLQKAAQRERLQTITDEEFRDLLTRPGEVTVRMAHMAMPEPQDAITPVVEA